MATVYLAEDVKHARSVALKVLHPEIGISLGVDRFLAEIRLTANLQHPNILPLYDSGAADKLVYYVMPFIEGETIRERMTREGQLPVGETIRMIQGAAAALDYAHRHDVVHRDIKPENILIQDGAALVADFGVALAVKNSASSRITQTGMSVGTPTYMSPEQAAAERNLDGRSDVYSLAAVMYEMLAGEPPFTGPNSGAIMARMMTEIPKSVHDKRSSVPDYVSDAIDRALEKVPADRFQTAAEFSAALERPSTSTYRATVRAARTRTKELMYVVSAIVLGVAGWIGGQRYARGEGAGDQPPSRLQLPAVSAFVNPVTRQTSISPAGDVVLFGYMSSDARQLFGMQSLDATAPTPFTNLPTDFGNPAWSPDGKWFVGSVPGDRHLYRQKVGGGEAETLPYFANAYTVDDRGTLWWQSDANDLNYVDAKGGVVPVKGLKPNLILQQILPGERHALMVRRPSQGAASGPLLVVDVRRGDETIIVPTGVVAAYYTAGLLVWTRLDGTIAAVPFDVGSRELKGSPVSVAANVSGAGSGVAEFAVSRSGTLVYRPTGPRNLVFVTRDGVIRSTIPGLAAYHGPKFSPDGRRLAFDITNSDGRDVWIYGVSDGAMTRASFVGDGHDVIWSPDGGSIAYVSGKSGALGIYRKRADGSTTADSLFAAPQLTYSGTWLSDGSAILTVASNLKEKSGSDIALVKNGGHGPLEAVLATPYEEMFPMLSPDGRWLAFVSDQAARPEVYVRPFGREGDQVQVSTTGGSEPVWSKDGKELFFRSLDKGGPVLVSASLQTQPTLSVATRRPLFSLAEFDPTSPHPNYDVSPDGKTFVMAKRNATNSNIMIIQNLPALVKKLQGATSAAH